MSEFWKALEQNNFQTDCVQVRYFVKYNPDTGDTEKFLCGNTQPSDTVEITLEEYQTLRLKSLIVKDGELQAKPQRDYTYKYPLESGEIGDPYRTLPDCPWIVADEHTQNPDHYRPKEEFRHE